MSLIDIPQYPLSPKNEGYRDGLMTKITFLHVDGFDYPQWEGCSREEELVEREDYGEGFSEGIRMKRLFDEMGLKVVEQENEVIV